MVTEDMKKLIGLSSEPSVSEVEKGAIQRFAIAVDDPNPLWTDEEYAKKSRYGGIIAPPGFFGWPAKAQWTFGMGGPMADVLAEFTKAGFPIVLDGGMAYEFFIPVRPGDTLVSTAKVTDIYERAGRAGTSLFGTIETTYVNQNGDIVAKGQATLIGRPLG